MVGTINTYLPFPHIIFACLVLNILSGCVVFPASHQITPEITGMIKIDDKPVAGARIIESFTSNVEGRMRDYPDRVVHTDSEGKFYLKERRFNTIVTFIGDWYNLTKLVVHAGQYKWIIYKSSQMPFNEIHIECDFHPSTEGHNSTDDYIPITNDCREITEKNKFDGKTKEEILDAIGEPVRKLYCRGWVQHGAEVWEYSKDAIGSKYRLLHFSITKGIVLYSRENFYEYDDCIDMPERQ